MRAFWHRRDDPGGQLKMSATIFITVLHKAHFYFLLKSTCFPNINCRPTVCDFVISLKEIRDYILSQPDTNACFAYLACLNQEVSWETWIKYDFGEPSY